MANTYMLFSVRHRFKLSLQMNISNPHRDILRQETQFTDEKAQAESSKVNLPKIKWQRGDQNPGRVFILSITLQYMSLCFTHYTLLHEETQINMRESILIQKYQALRQYSLVFFQWEDLTYSCLLYTLHISSSPTFLYLSFSSYFIYFRSHNSSLTSYSVYSFIYMFSSIKRFKDKSLILFNQKG